MVKVTVTKTVGSKTITKSVEWDWVGIISHFEEVAQMANALLIDSTQTEKAKYKNALDVLNEYHSQPGGEQGWYGGLKVWLEGKCNV